MTKESNLKAIQNGKIGEEVFKNFMTNQDYIVSQLNDLLVDFTVNGAYYEVKTCQVYTLDFSHSNGSRSGRYVLDKDQHDFLIQNNGYYFFVLLTSLKPYIVLKNKFVKASDIEFKVTLVWKKIFNEKEVFNG